MQQIRYFVALCEEKTFTKAARRCGVAQPSVTNAIKSLEKALGAPLFVRRRGSTQLTDLGEYLAPYFFTIWSSAEAVKRVSLNNAARNPSSIQNRAETQQLTEAVA
jgi:DNA-binding transcriptional LysR family regulator